MANDIYSARFQPLSGNGAPYPGALRYCMSAGGSWPVNASALFSDSACTTPVSNPVVADANGRFATCYLADNTSYLFVFTDGTGTIDPNAISGVTLWSDDNAIGSLSPTSSSSLLGASSSATPAVEGDASGAGPAIKGDASGGTGPALYGVGNAQAAPLKLLGMAADPLSPAQGMLYPSSATGKWSFYNGVAVERIVSQLHSISAHELQALNAIYSGSQYSLPANSLRVGSRLRVRAFLKVDSVSGSTGGIYVALMLAGTVVNEIPFTFSATLSSAVTFLAEFEILLTSNSTFTTIGTARFGTVDGGVGYNIGLAINTAISNVIAMKLIPFNSGGTPAANVYLELFEIEACA